jgi:CBS domain-containing membrane protein
MSNLKVRDLMTERVSTVRPDDDLTRLYDLMDGEHIRHVPVVDADGTLVGIVSHRDLVRGAARNMAELPVTLQRNLLRRTRVDEVMTVEPETVEPEVDAREAGERMLEQKLSCLPVIEDAQLVGIITEADFVRYVVSA